MLDGAQSRLGNDKVGGAHRLERASFNARGQDEWKRPSSGASRHLSPEGEGSAPLPPGEGSGRRPQGEGSLARPDFILLWRPRPCSGVAGPARKTCVKPLERLETGAEKSAVSSGPARPRRDSRSGGERSSDNRTKSRVAQRRSYRFEILRGREFLRKLDARARHEAWPVLRGDIRLAEVLQTFEKAQNQLGNAKPPANGLDSRSESRRTA